jgi:ABC-type multidrug transport system ATPase subunit
MSAVSAVSDAVVVDGLCLRLRDSLGNPLVVGPISFQLKAGQRVAVVGGAGVGKSALLSVLGGLIGDCVSDGHASVAAPVGVVFARDALDADFDVFKNVVSIADDDEAAAAILDALGLRPFARRQAGALSGGQRRRVAIARALAARPRVLLLDDPTAGLDAVTALEVLGTIDRLAPHAAVVISAQDVDVVVPWAESALSLQRHGGRVTATMMAPSALPPPFCPRPPDDLVRALVGAAHVAHGERRP